MDAKVRVAGPKTRAPKTRINKEFPYAPDELPAEPYFLVTFKISSYDLPSVAEVVGLENLTNVELTEL
jgi:hypothetical protein